MNTWTKLLCLSLAILVGRTATSAPNTSSLDNQPLQGAIHVVRQGPGVTAPEPIQPSQPLNVPDKCKGKIKGKVRLSVIVDAQGAPQNVSFVQALGTDLDRLALLYLDAERFKPGTQNGQPVAVGQSVELEIVACSVDGPKQGNKRVQLLHLRSLPTQKLYPAEVIPEDVIFGPTVAQNMTKEFNAANLDKVGQHPHEVEVKEPKLIQYSEARYSEEARRKHITGTTVVSLVIDSNGMPQKIYVAKPLGYGLDEEAIAAVHRYRFSPALRNGSPVAVPVSVQVNFRLY